MAPTPAALPPRATLLAALREAYAGPAWHGPSVRAALRGVDAAGALARPASVHNGIWELVRHLAYGRHLVIRRLLGDAADDEGGPAPFPHRLRAPWWPVPPETTDERAWRADLRLLDRYQRELLETVDRLPTARFAERRRGKRHTLGQEVLGLALHDAYHAGQIRLVRVLAGV